mgnify:FL=1
MKKLAIPKTPDDPTRRAFDESVKTNLELVMGHRGGKIEPLKSTATLPEVVAKINEIISCLQ